MAKDTRVHEWVNIETFDPLYGVQVRRNGKWMHTVSDGTFALFPTRAEAEALADDISSRLAARPA